MKQQTDKQAQKNGTAVLDIVYYTDPLCCWSWAFEPQWRRLRYEYGSQINWRYCMGGLLADWSKYNDPLNAISRPVQMGPLWFEAKHMSGMPIADRIWMEDPPASSYPACIAVKCAALQSAEAEELYLRKLREAVMLHTKNIARQPVLIAVAEEVAQALPGKLDFEQFKKDIQQGAGNEAFREDLKKTSYHQISRFPTLTISRNGAKGIMIVGYRPYKILMQAISIIAPDLTPVRDLTDTADYIRYWNGATDREVAEVAERNERVQNAAPTI